MACVVYVSSATEPMSAADIEEIVDVSDRNNARDGITGMMLYADGNIIQAIEGPEPAVLNLMDRLRADSRHHEVTVIAMYPVDRRQFPDWKMGVRQVSDAQSDDVYRVFADLHEPVFDAEKAELNSVARKLLEGFRRRNLI